MTRRFGLTIKRIISRKPRWLAAAPYLEQLIPAPVFIIIHVTLGCKKSCEFCYQMRDEFFNMHEGILPVSDFEKILCQAGKFLYKPHIHLFGGEPLDHPEFPRLLSLCRQYRFRPTFTTNGELLLRFAQTIRDSSVTQINLSLEPLRHPGDFPATLLKAIAALSPRVRFNANYTITRQSLAALQSTIEACSLLFPKGEIETFVCQHWAFEEKDQPEVRGWDIAGLKGQLAEIESRSWPFRFITMPQIAREDIESYYTDWDYPFARKCCVPWLGLSVYPDLSVTPGGASFACTEIVGTMQKQTLSSLWHSPSLKSFRGRVRREFPRRCTRCCHHAYY
ncbi:MAG: radical SAM protein [Candidatus Aureabacteria bacterium]|nr:radical SAM protein [Candidatus Auribacterota bacterium]